jgi:hypothetical protein
MLERSCPIEEEPPADRWPASFHVADGLVVARREVPGLFLLNLSATFIWESLKDGICIEEISSSLSQACGIPHATAEHDVRKAIRHWSELGLTPQSTGRI